MAVIGNFFALYAQGQRVALATSNNAQFKAETVDTTNKDSGLFTEVRPIKKILSADIEAIYCSTTGNLVQFPESFDNAVWAIDGEVQPGKVAGPTGQMLAQTVRISAAGGYIEQEITAPAGSSKKTASIWASGSGDVVLTIEQGSSYSLTIHLSATLTRFEIPMGVAASGGTIIIRVSNNDLIDNDVVLFGAQVNIGDTATDYMGSAVLASQLAAWAHGMTKLAIRHSTDLSGDFQVAGDAYITNIEFKASDKDVLKFSATLNGTADQTVTTI